MRTAAFTVVGILLALLSWVSIRTLDTLPNVFSRPYRRIYAGGSLRNLPIRIEVDGKYQVRLETPHRMGEIVQWPQNPPLAVRIEQGGLPIGKSSRGGAWGTQSDWTNLAEFRARRGDVVRLSVTASPSFGRLVPRRSTLDVARVPIGYARFFATRFLLQFFAFFCAGLSLFAFALAWLTKRRLERG